MPTFILVVTVCWILVLLVYKTAWAPRWQRFNASVTKCRQWLVARLTGLLKEP